MLNRLVIAALLFALPAARAVAQEPYGSIADVKLLKKEDGTDMPTVPAPTGAMILFNGKSLDGWTRDDGKFPTWKLLPGGIMQVHGGDIVTKEKFTGKFKLHVEFRVPYLPKAKEQGQPHGDSGVYLQGRYEIQVVDSYGWQSKDIGCGAIYKVAAPLVNACKAPTVWQSYDIVFQSPRCDHGKIVEAGIVTVHQNGVLIHEKLRLVRKRGDKEEFVKNTPSGLGGDPCSPGPIMLQDYGGPVQFRNIWLVKE